MSSCPYCGVHMTKTKTGLAHPENDWNCFMSGVHVGDKLVPKFEKRAVQQQAATTGLYYEIKDNRPVFNTFNQGTAVTVEFLTAMVAYYTGATA